MNPHAWTEDQLVEQPAIGLFTALGWQTVSAMEETYGIDGTLGRETKGEVVLTVRLRAALAGTRRPAVSSTSMVSVSSASLSATGGGKAAPVRTTFGLRFFEFAMFRPRTPH